MDGDRLRAALAEMAALTFPDWSGDDDLDDLLGDLREVDAYLAGRASSALASGRFTPDDHDDISDLQARLRDLSGSATQATVAQAARYLEVMDRLLDAMHGR